MELYIKLIDGMAKEDLHQQSPINDNLYQHGSMILQGSQFNWTGRWTCLSQNYEAVSQVWDPGEHNPRWCPLQGPDTVKLIFY